jgi:sarcosine oxidase
VSPSAREGAQRSSTATLVFDVAVVGLGAAGSATIQALARRGLRTIGLDRYHPPHHHGSTHGRSRVIREAYYESPAYVPLVQWAYQEWDRIGRDSGRPLLRQTGGLMLGSADGELVAGALQSATLHGLPHELLGPAEIRRRFPIFEVSNEQVGLLEPRAGFLDPEGCVSACLELSVRAGATLRFETLVTGWRRSGAGLRVHTSGGDVECGALVLAAGPWLPALLGESVLPLTVERQVMYWFEPLSAPERFGADRCPVFIWEWDQGRFFYGIPDHGHGFKTAVHHEGQLVSPEGLDRSVGAAELEAVRALLLRAIPDAPGRLREAAVCLYTNTPDRHFVLGRHPDEPGIMLASPCSGHGFKFASAIGEVLADLVVAGESRFDLGLFAPGRFRVGGGRSNRSEK